MDENNQANNSQISPPNISSDPKADAQRDYQDILDKYANQIKSEALNPSPELPPQNLNTQVPDTQPLEISQAPISPPIEESVDPSLSSPQTPLEPPIATTPLNVSDPSVVSPQQPSFTPPPAPDSLPPQPPINTSDFAPQSKPSGFNFFKILFIFSLIVFLGVASAVVYNLFIGNKSNPASLNEASTSPSPATASPASNPILATACELNNQTYQVGESFPAADGCNSCTCTSDLLITCTEKTCDQGSAATTGNVFTLYESKNGGISFKYPGNYGVTSCDSDDPLPGGTINLMANGSKVKCGAGFAADIAIKFYSGPYDADTSQQYVDDYQFKRTVIKVGQNQVSAEKIELISVLPDREVGPAVVPMTIIRVPHSPIKDSTEFSTLTIDYLSDVVPSSTISQMLNSFTFAK